MILFLLWATLRSQNELPGAPSENRKIRGFRAALEGDEQSALSYRVLDGGALADIIMDIDDRVLSPLSMCLEVVSKLL